MASVTGEDIGSSVQSPGGGGETKGGGGSEVNRTSEANGKPYQKCSNLKDMIKRGKNEVSFEETVNLLDDATQASPQPSPQPSESAHCLPISADGTAVVSPTNEASNDNLDIILANSNGAPASLKCDAPTPNAFFPNEPPPTASSSANHHLPERAIIASGCQATMPDSTGDAPQKGHPVLKSILSNAHQPLSANDESTLKRPPDGGWGWVVVFASFMINLITDGISLSFGVLFVELVEYFHESKSKTSWVGSLFLSIPLLTGPIASGLTDHFGCRKVAICGSFFAAFGFILGSFGTQLEHLFVAFSISGFGISLLQVSSIVSVAYYFEKRRSLATGLSVCGTGMGTLVFAPLVDLILKSYHWQMTMMILGGVFMTIIFFALLIRDLDLDFDSDSEDDSSSSSGDSTSDVESNVIDSDCLGFIAEENENSDNESVDDDGNNTTGGGHHSRHNSSRMVSPVPRGGGDNNNHNSSNESIASNEYVNTNKRISFGKTTRMRHISEGEPVTESMQRTCSSLINIPTYIKNSASNKAASAASQKSGDVADESGSGVETGEGGSKADGNHLNDSIGELTFRRGGYLHNLITYYPHLLSLFLPWNLECNDLTIKTVPSKSREHIPSFSPPENKRSKEEEKENNATERKDAVMNNLSAEESATEERRLTVDFSSPPPTPTSQMSSSENELSHHQTDSVAIPVPEFNFRPTRAGGSRGLVGRRGHRHRLHQHPPSHNDLFGNYLHNLRLQRGSLTYRSAMLIISKYKLKASSAPDIYRTSMATINEDKGFSFFRNLKSILRDMFDLSLFKNIPYTVFCISNFLLYACVDIPYVYLPDQAITSGSFDKEGSAKLISIIGFVNTLGVVLIGYIGDKPWLDASMIYSFFIAISGLALGAIPLQNDAVFVSTCTAIYGFAISANYSLVSVILVELITLDSFTQAYGLLLLVQGIASLIGPPIVGLIFDSLNSYSLAFYVTGLCGFISALLVIPVCNRRNCFFWSYRLSRSGSSTSFIFKPLSFIKEGVYGPTVCSKRNVDPSVRLFRQQLANGKRVVKVDSEPLMTNSKHPVNNGGGSEQQHQPTVTPPAGKSNGHHVVIIDEDAGGGGGGSTGGADDDDSKRFN